MTATQTFLWVVLPYVTTVAFAVGMFWRYRYDQYGWTTRSSQMYESRLLRIGSPLFHFGILMALGGHILGLLVPAGWTEAVGVSEHVYHVAAVAFGVIAAVMVVTGLAILVYRRRTVGRVFTVTTPMDKLMYVMLGSVVLVGVFNTVAINLLNITGEYPGGYNYRETVAVWFRSLFVFSPDASGMVLAPPLLPDPRSACDAAVRADPVHPARAHLQRARRLPDTPVPRLSQPRPRGLCSPTSTRVGAGPPQVSTSTVPARRAARRPPMLPPQHGAWAFLALPIVLACTVVSPTGWTAVLAVAWFAAYPASYAGARLLHDRRPERFRLPFLLWVACAAVPAVLLLFRFSWLLWVGAVLVGLVAVNARYARRNDERALINDLVVVTECALLVPVTWGVSTGATTVPTPASLPAQIGVLTAVCWLVLVGSTLHVKSLIRERRDPRYARASRGVALASVGVSVALATRWGLPEGWWLVPPFIALAVRAFVVGRRPSRPAVIGLVELAMLVLVTLGAWLA